MSLARRTVWVLAAVCLSLAGRVTEARQDWPGEFGSARTGVIAVEAAPLARAVPAWRAVAGLGTAPPVVVDGRVYVYGLFKPGTDLTDRDPVPGDVPTLDELPQAFRNYKDPAKPGYHAPDPSWRLERWGRTEAWMETHVLDGPLWAMCLDAATGRALWRSRVTDRAFAYSINYPRSSPLLHDGKLYIHERNGGVFCLDAATGRKLWETSLLDHGMFAYDHTSGNLCSPVAAGGHVVVSFKGEVDDRSGFAGMAPGSFHLRLGMVVAGLDPATGAVRWRTPGPMAGYMVPSKTLAVGEFDGVPAVVGDTTNGLIAIDPRDGKLLWAWDARKHYTDLLPPPEDSPEGESLDPALRKEWWNSAVQYPYGNLVSTVYGNRVLGTLYQAHDFRSSRTYCLRVENGKPVFAWDTPDMVSRLGNRLAKDGRIYGYDSQNCYWIRSVPGTRVRTAGVEPLQCYDLETGRLVWSSAAMNDPGLDAGAGMNIFHGEALSVLAGATLVTCHPGSRLVFGRVAPDGVTRLGEIVLGPPGKSQVSVPVVAGGRLFFRLVEPTRDADSSGNLVCLTPPP